MDRIDTIHQPQDDFPYPEFRPGQPPTLDPLVCDGVLYQMGEVICGGCMCKLHEGLAFNCYGKAYTVFLPCLHCGHQVYLRGKLDAIEWAQGVHKRLFGEANEVQR